MKELRTRRRWLFATVWALITIALFTISGFLFHFPGALPPNNGNSFFAAGFAGAVVNGLPAGILVGLSQMFVLRVAGVRSWRWVAGTAVALWLTHTVGDVFPDPLGIPLMVLLGGLLLGALQWWALRWPGRDGLLWMATTAACWSLGLWLGFLMGAGSHWRTEHILAGLMTGLLLGVGTGVLWLRILAQASGTDHGLSARPAQN